jgi:hypothetical protein
MTTQTDREIIARYPRLFDTDVDFTATAMDRGFENVGPGWIPVMTQLCERLVPLAQADFRIVAVKSKFATLRIHCRGGNDATDAVVDRAKALALSICERCGRPGTQQTTAADELVVRCEHCAAG